MKARTDLKVRGQLRVEREEGGGEQRGSSEGSERGEAKD